MAGYGLPYARDDEGGSDDEEARPGPGPGPGPTAPSALGEPKQPVRGQSVPGGRGPDGELSHGQELVEAQRAARAARAAQSDLSTWKYDPNGQQVQLPEAGPKGGALSDFARQMWVSTLDMGQQAIGAASFTARQLGADPETVQHIEQTKANVADYAAKQTAKMSAGAQEAMHASLFGGKDSEGHDIPTPNSVGWAHYVGATLAGLVPQVALAALPGGLVGRVVSAAGFGALDAGGAYNAITEGIDKAKPAELMRSPVYAALIAQNVPDLEARKQLVQSIAPAFVAGHFAVGTIAGAGVGGLVTKGAAGGAGRGAMARMGIGAAEGAAVMGGQGGADNALDQGAMMQAGVQTGFDPTATAQAFAGGALGGAILGAAGGVFHKAEARKVAETEPVNGVPPAEAAALAGTVPAELLQIEGPKKALGIEGPQDPLRIEGPKDAPPAADNGPIGMPSGMPPTPPEPVIPRVRGQSAQEDSQPGLSGRNDISNDPLRIEGPKDALPAADNGPIRMPDGTTPAPVIPRVRGQSAQEDRQPGVARPVSDEIASRAAEAPAVAPELPPAVAAVVGKAKGKGAGKGKGKSKAVEPTPETTTTVGETKAGETLAEPGETAPAERTYQNPEPKAAAPAAAAPPINRSYKVGADGLPVFDVRSKEARDQGKTAPAPVAESAPAPAQTPTPKQNAEINRRKQVKEQRAETERLAAEAVETSKKAEKYVAEGPVNDAAPTKPPVSHAEAMDNMRGALTTVGQSISPITKGQIGPALTKARREIEKMISEMPPTEEGVHAAIAQWGKSSTEPLPMSTTKRRPIADEMLKLLTGKGYESELAKIGDERPSVYESKGTAKRADAETVHTKEADITASDGKKGTAAEDRSEGVTNYDAKEKVRSVESNTERTGQDLLDKVLAGTMDVHEAHAAMGTKEAGTPGAPRKLADFGAVLDAAIKHAEDPVEQVKLKAALERSKATDSAQQAGAGTKAIQKLMAETGKERAAELRELKAKLDDPVGAATTVEANRGTTDASGRVHLRDSTIDGISKESSRYVQMMADPRVNGDVMRSLRASESIGAQHTTHDLLRSIINSSLAKSEARPMHELAKRLLKIAPELDVMTSERAAERGLSRPEDFGMGDHYLGATMHDARGTPTHIILKADMGFEATQHIETALHEIIHTITSRHIEAGGDAGMLRSIANEIRRRAPTDDVLDRMGVDGSVVGHALRDAHELHAMIMTNPSLQAVLARMPASEAFRAEMRAQGYDVREPGRSMWRYFTDFIRNTLGLPKVGSASEMSLLDHVLRPMQDVTDRASAYNRAVADPVVRSMGEPMLRSIGGTLSGGKEATRAIWDRFDWQGAGDKFKKAALQFAPTDHIIKWNEKLFGNREGEVNPLHAFRTANEAIAHASAVAQTKYADRANAIVKAIQGSDKPALAKLMNEATLNNVQLGKGADNAHLKSREELAIKADLEKRFDALPEQAQTAYENARDLYKEMHGSERRAQLEGIVKGVMPDASAAERAAVIDALSTKAKTAALLKDDSPLAKTFGAAWLDSTGQIDPMRRVVRAIAQVHSRGFVQGDYFPLKRYGDYVVRYGSGETMGVEMFERRRDAEARRAELKAQDMDDLAQVQTVRQHMDQAPHPDSKLVNELYDAMRKRPGMDEHAEAVRNVLNGVLLEHTSRSETSRSAMRRRGVVGASEDIVKTIAQEVMAHGGKIGHALHDGERAQAMRDIALRADELGKTGEQGEGITARSVYNELQLRNATGDDAAGAVSSVMRKATTFGYVQSLMSFSHMVTGTVEIHMNSTSLLGARHGYGQATLALSRALADVSPRILKQGAAMTIKAMGGKLKSADWNMSAMARDQLIERGANKAHMTELFSQLDKAGLIDHSMQREMQRMANPGGFSETKAGGLWQRFLDLNAAGAHAVDVSNKSAVAKAAFDLEMRNTHNKKGAEQAIAHAIQTVRDVGPNYNLHNKARITTAAGPLGAFAAPMTQFKQYGLSMYGLMANLTKASMHNMPSAERTEARRAFAGILATHAAMAGGLTLIADPLRYIGGAYDIVTGADRPHDYQTDVRGFMAELLGPELAEVAMRGVPHALGFDIHRRVGLGNLLEMPELESFDKKGVLKMMATAMTGAAGEDAAAMVGGMVKFRNGDLQGGAIDMVPRVVRDVFKAVRLADQGVVDGRGMTILPAAKLSTADIAYQGLGFQPSRVSEFREGRAAVSEAKQEAQAERTKLETAWIKASPTDRAGIMSHIREFNQANPGMALTVDQMVRAQEAQRKNTTTVGTFGLRLPAKAQAALAASGKFANVN